MRQRPLPLPLYTVHLDKMPASAVYVLDLKGKVRWGVVSFYSIVLEGRKSGRERLSTDTSLSMSRASSQTAWLTQMIYQVLLKEWKQWLAS